MKRINIFIISIIGVSFFAIYPPKLGITQNVKPEEKIVPIKTNNITIEDSLFKQTLDSLQNQSYNSDKEVISKITEINRLLESKNTRSNRLLKRRTRVIQTNTESINLVLLKFSETKTYRYNVDSSDIVNNILTIDFQQKDKITKQ